MIRIDLSDNVKGTAAALNDLQRRQLPFAIARSLTRTAAEFSRDHLGKVLEQQLPEHNPTPFTKRAGRYLPATKASLTATVYLAPQQDRYLRVQRAGGARNVKAFENKYESIAQAIQKAQLVPTKRVTRNQYGNVSRAAIVRLGQAAQSDDGTVLIGQPLGRNGKPRSFGVYQRDKRTNTLRALFVKPRNRPNYKRSLQLDDALKNFASERFDFHLQSSIAIALATAK